MISSLPRYRHPLPSRIGAGRGLVYRRLLPWALLLLAACKGTPVPPDKAEYVGRWEAVGMSLIITADGGVAYQRIKGSGKTSVNAPLKEFRGNDFVVGLGPFTTTFQVSRPPYREGDRWKMVVDGVELVRLSPGQLAELAELAADTP
jgi:hypothetical protein